MPAPGCRASRPAAARRSRRRRSSTTPTCAACCCRCAPATEAMRALTYLAAAAIDASRAAGDDKARFRAQRRADLLIPVVKAWCTDLGVEIASTGIQVHGGMGYIEETGAAQYLPRRPHRADLRGHQRHPGERSGRPQARPRPGRGGARAVRRDAADSVGARRPGRMGTAASRPRRGARRARTRHRPSRRGRSRHSPPPARRPISRCSARSPAAG